MSDQELERIAELIFQKLLIRQKEFEEEERTIKYMQYILI